MKLSTPAEAEAAFYEAFSKADLDQMKAVWLDSPGVICTHPMAERIVGYRLVIGSFLGLFQGQGELAARITQVESLLTADLCVHTGVEVLHQDASEFRMQVTNVYRATNDGWRMVLHHASPVHTAKPPSRLQSKVH